nr:hypothetical protein [uncultured Desulfobacter sp.]
MHITGEEILWLLNKNGVIVSKAWGGTGNLTIEGNAYGDGNASFASFTDRTPFYEGDALSEIAKISGKGGEIDHSTLPNFAQRHAEVPVYKEVALQEIATENAFESVWVDAEKVSKTLDNSGNVVKNKVSKSVQKISKGFRAENGKIVEIIEETPVYESEQVEKIQLKSDVYLDEMTGKVYQKTGNGEIYKKDGTIYQNNQTGIEKEEQRDIGAMVSILTVAVQQLNKKNAALKENNKQLEERLSKLESMLAK